MNTELSELGLEIASKLGATYADVRFVDKEDSIVGVKNGKPDGIMQMSESGFGVRVIVDNGWGFAGTYRTSKKDMEETVKKAIKIGKASARLAREPIRLTPAKTVKDKYTTKYEVDPFTVPIEETLGLLLDADKAYRAKAPHAKTTGARIYAKKEQKYIATSEGSRIDQTIVLCGGDGEGYLIEGGLVQNRGWDFTGMTKGYEYVKAQNLVAMAEEAAVEAEKLLKAKPCPTEIKTNLILDDAHIALQIHETIGHATELDRVLGTEVDLAGMSFLTPDKLGKFQYGSKHTSFCADATIPGGVATYGYDDEGTPAKKQYLVKEGKFVGYQSSRETAAQLGLKEGSAGMRASNCINMPLVRMTNIYLEPGTWKAAEIIEDTKDGVLMRTTKMWSVDDRRLNFQFGCEIGWIIKNGEIKEMIRDPTYTGISYEFWRNLDATAKDDWTLYGTMNCGKGRPGQMMYVGHGGGRTRVQDVRIGITGRM